MEHKSGKPPIELEEMEPSDDGTKEVPEVTTKTRKTTREAPSKGLLSYMGRGSGSGGGPKFGRFSGGGGTFSKQNLILIGLAVLLAFTISLFVFTRQSDSETLLDNQKILQSSINTQKGRIDTILASSYLTSDALNTALLGYAKDTDIPNLANYITNTELTGIINKLPTHNLTSYAYLTKSSDIYYLHMEANPGTYIAEISLTYPTPYTLDATSLEDAYSEFGSTWTGRNFFPYFASNGTIWKVVRASFCSNAFDTTGEIYSTSLGSFNAPGSYTVSVEVLPSVKPGSSGGI